MSAAQTPRGGGARKGETQLRGAARAAGLARARQWREEMKPYFDQLDAAGFYLDSPARYGPK